MYQVRRELVPNTDMDRRSFFRRSGAGLLSGGAVLLLAGGSTVGLSRTASAESEADDVAILTSALAAEREAIAAYQVGAESGLLSSAVLPVAVQFQGHHKDHADLLASTIGDLGGAVPEAPGGYDFPVDQLQSEADVLRFAAALEKGAVSAYLGAVPLFDNRDLSQAAASILGDEAMHWAVLRSVLGEDPVPVSFVS